MNSVEAYKGFITFLILGTVVLISVFGFRFVMQSSNTTSQASEPVISDPMEVSTVAVGMSEVKIRWKTEKPTETRLRYSKNKSISPYEEHLDAEKRTEHEVILQNLEVDVTYNYIIINGGQQFPRSGDPFTFRTGVWKPIAPVIIEKNNTAPQERTQTEPTTPQAENTTPQPTTTDQPAPEVTPTPEKTPDYSGISDATEFNPRNQTLGRSTDIIGESIIKEFQEAILFQDLNYDFDQNAIVDTNDYPLFINFILNQE